MQLSFDLFAPGPDAKASKHRFKGGLRLISPLAPMSSAPARLIEPEPAPRPPESLRARIAKLERGGHTPSRPISLGDPFLDACMPGGGLPTGRWHEIEP